MKINQILREDRGTLDYGVTVRDHTGRVVTLSINGASIDELIRGGYSEAEAREAVESNTFQTAIYDGEIAPGAWQINPNDV